MAPSIPLIQQERRLWVPSILDDKKNNNTFVKALFTSESKETDAGKPKYQETQSHSWRIRGMTVQEKPPSLFETRFKLHDGEKLPTSLPAGCEIRTACFLNRQDEIFKVAVLEKHIQTKSKQFKIFNVQGGELPITGVESQSVGTLVLVPHLNGAAGTPSPSIDVTDKFSVRQLPKNIELSYEANEEKHYLHAYVDKNNQLSFSIRAQGDRKTQGSGRDMVISLMNRLEKQRIAVDHIQAHWATNDDSVNTKKYLENLEQGMSEKDAATNTWTGRMLGEYGFHPQVFRTSEDKSSIYVVFKK